ncbi:MAG: hypothetical protein M3R15_10575 [Acidobacteriota bacterium]|nr:hypothetical protein [Acidobacteriota bacterium]
MILSKNRVPRLAETLRQKKVDSNVHQEYLDRRFYNFIGRFLKLFFCPDIPSFVRVATARPFGSFFLKRIVVSFGCGIGVRSITTTHHDMTTTAYLPLPHRTQGNNLADTRVAIKGEREISFSRCAPRQDVD